MRTPRLPNHNVKGLLIGVFWWHAKCLLQLICSACFHVEVQIPQGCALAFPCEWQWGLRIGAFAGVPVTPLFMPAD